MTDTPENNVNPWLRLLTPVLLALVTFIMTMNYNLLDNMYQELKAMRVDIVKQGLQIENNRTKINLYHQESESESDD